MNELILKNPAGDMKVADEVCRYIAARKAELLASARALVIDKNTWDNAQTKQAIEELTEAVEDLRDKGKKFVEKVLADAEALCVVTAIDKRLWTYSTRGDALSAYTALKTELDALKAKVAEYKAANTPQPPSHDYVVRMTCTDAVLADVVKYAAKKGATAVKYATPGNDKSFIALDKWMKENS